MYKKHTMDATDKQIKDLTDRIRTIALGNALDTITKLEDIVCKSCMSVEDMKEYAILHESLIKEVKTVTPLTKTQVPSSTLVPATVVKAPKAVKTTLDVTGNGSERVCFWLMQKLDKKGHHCDKPAYWRPERERWECTTHLNKTPKVTAPKKDAVQKQPKKSIPSLQLTPKELSEQLKKGKITNDKIQNRVHEIHEDEDTLTPNQVIDDDDEDEE